ncbi:hypothetical protein FBU30_009614 [Linnemannia zychae]|nr:hypothetical protein FBU30_009614 [Linnemannia zychae]
MSVFELQIDPERNAIIRRALAKRIVQQREEEEEEASTEEDESFLGNSIAIVRTALNSPSPSPLLAEPSKNHPNHDHRGISGPNSIPDSERMNVRSRWKIEYLRTKSSSPAGSVDTIAETLPELLKKNSDLGDTNNTPNQDAPAIQPTPEDTISATSVSESIVEKAVIEEPSSTTLAPPPSVETDVSKEAQSKHAPTENGTLIEMESEVDSVERDILLQLEELKKEKSRLFALFRSALQKKEQEPQPPPVPVPVPVPVPSLEEPISASTPSKAPSLPLDVPPPLPQPPRLPQPPQPLHIAEVRNEKSSTIVMSETPPRMTHVDRSSRDGKGGRPMNIKDESRRSDGPRRAVDHGHDRRPEPSRPNVKRREHERVIDRSKLNLEIPRKPTLSNSSSNSTSSTPTNSFASPPSSATGTSMMKPKRPRSISPIMEDGPSNNSNNYHHNHNHNHHNSHHRGSGAGSFGPNYSSTSSSYSDSASTSNKYPRAEYLGSVHSNNRQGGGANSNNNSSNSSNINNGLPEKPQVRHHHHHHHSGISSSTSSSARGLGADGYHGDDGYHRGKSSSGPSSLMSSGMNSGGGGSSYRQQGSGGSLGYHQNLPPTRIGFGNSNNNSSNSNSNNNSGGISGSGTGSHSVGTGSSGRGGSGYYGHNDGPPPISLLGPPGGRPLSFNRHMMQMPHARGGMLRSRPGFGGGGGGRGGGGPLERPMSSGRPGDWPRRRSRA